MINWNLIGRRKKISIICPGFSQSSIFLLDWCPLLYLVIFLNGMLHLDCWQGPTMSSKPHTMWQQSSEVVPNVKYDLVLVASPTWHWRSRRVLSWMWWRSCWEHNHNGCTRIRSQQGKLRIEWMWPIEGHNTIHGIHFLRSCLRMKLEF